MRKNSIYKLLLGGALPFLLVSCFAAKDYERPEIEEISEELYRTDNLPQDSLNMATISWTEIFTDPILKNHIEEGLENNIDIRIAIQQMLAAEAYVKQGKASYFPTLNAGPSVSHQILSPNSQFGSFFDGSITQYDITGNLSWEADIWGKIRSNDRAFTAAYLQSEAAHKAVKTQLISNIANNYYQLLSLDEQLRIAQETLETRKSSLETTEALKDAGNVTEVGVQQTKAQLHTAEALVVQLKNQIRLLENSFSILLGAGPQEIERTDLAKQNIVSPLNTGVPSQLLRNRPDVIAAEYGLINAFELTNAARANFYPSLTLTASGGFQSLELDKLLNANSLFANLGASLLQPIINKRQIRTQYEVSQAQQEEALLNFKQAILVAGREVSDALSNYQASTERIDILENEYEAYNKASGYSEELLNNGLINYLEVLTARENALNSQLNLINAEYNKLNSIVNLYKALGGGWQ
ncbi:efflux transporter outer membrane subunit [Salegentibacter salegens]|uniref:Efflux transporter, outer membrane factor (OMF) lipoprotein, NodT family n=1 Tax=Salegentibacter salegens TaxID=143223 RepID=A0A1M7M6D1_9FLAO|nr:TolC family protein [Salegentibacter salegens]PRX51516.1 NodT family efflux transporter outer membrane factor (OMF) lipoprotein [Salegentibacter salegens]SHM86272.1 efflux transporter, outer membrane factor (OMF) lipoprotein, NodT family [Salegentibacter salegens]